MLEGRLDLDTQLLDLDIQLFKLNFSSFIHFSRLNPLQAVSPLI